MATSECLYTFRHLIDKLINTGWTVKLVHDPSKCGQRARLMSEGPDNAPHAARRAAPLPGPAAPWAAQDSLRQPSERCLRSCQHERVKDEASGEGQAAWSGAAAGQDAAEGSENGR